MGKTVESYRMALESEISRWNGFARALRKEDREAFDEELDYLIELSHGNRVYPACCGEKRMALGANPLCHRSLG